MTNEYFNLLLILMAAIAAIVFVTLYFVEAGYGMLFDKKWGKPIPNKIAWVCMEAPVFIVMLVLWAGAGRNGNSKRFPCFSSCSSNSTISSGHLSSPCLSKAKARCRPAS